MAIPVVVIPHATVLAFRRLGDVVHVWCPECGAALRAPLTSAAVPTGDMAHKAGCGVAARIKRADERYDAAGLARWWKPKP